MLLHNFKQGIQNSLTIWKRNGTCERAMVGRTESGQRRRGLIVQRKGAEQWGEMGGMELEGGHDASENMFRDCLFHERRLPC